jgi:hypothetical protein
VPGARRVRPVDERKKAKNLLFLHHTVAVTDVLIAAKLLAKTHPLIELSSLYTERSLKRKISVVRPDNQRIYVEPDASCELLISKPWHEPPQTWQDFVHLELYRHRPLEGRFKQKIWGYVTALDTGIHDALFKTSALSIAVMCDTAQQTALLKRWTEETLTAMGRREEGEMFCFRTLHTATASPEEMYLAPMWEQAFGTTKTPLLVLE